ncbi:MAG: hypothetical protein M1449_04285 [Candidatus Thermoplasmatota archaeon]|nr:hypothetical protein [Candidatus Thermoplasmatota archaeon]MCL5059786.1 hypothetical protein [Candidatus Thermoplasmatota archaeon]
MLCLLPLQISWAAGADYCGHDQSHAAQHFGHHDDPHEAPPSPPDDGKQPEQSNPVHDHCHLSGFLGVLSAFTLTACHVSQSALHREERFYRSLAPDQPERPKWSVPA